MGKLDVDEAGSFGLLLRQYRQATGLSQLELAERAGLSRRGVSDLERGARRRPYPATVRQLAAALALSEEQRGALLVAARHVTTSAHVPAHTTHQSAAPSEASALSTRPRPITSFIGRERSLDELIQLLGTARLLTLAGTGGVGKTRLALALADEHTAAIQRWTPVFVDLAPLEDPRLVVLAVAVAVGLREQPDRPILATLVEALQRREILLILDNCEHLIQTCAELGHALLASCPELRLLATSREPLGIAGEIVWRVPSLILPEPNTSLERIREAASVQLFVARASSIMPDFALNQQNSQAVATICRHLDGIPLALELAAARVSLLAPGQIAARLDDTLGLLAGHSRLTPVRQQTLRATVDWSYWLLSLPEQRLFARLTVFAGDFSLEAAEAVAGADGLARREVLQVLGQLVDKSLVVAESGLDGMVRYRLLETLRQYGLERLADRGEIATFRERHADFFLALVEQVEPMLHGHSGLLALETLEREHDNCRAALRWLVVAADVDRSQRLAGALGRFWFFRGYLTEADEWTARALALPDGNQPTPGRAKTLHGACAVALARGNYPAVERFAEEARDLWHQLGNRAEEGFAHFVLGQAAERQGAVEIARGHFEMGLKLTRAAGHGAGEANNLFGLSELAYRQGDDNAAHTWAEATLACAVAAGWAVGISNARRILGAVSLRRGEYPAATRFLEASLADARAQRTHWWIAETLAPLGQLALEQGDSSLAHARLTESLQLAWELADRSSMARALEGLALLAAVWGMPQRALHLAGAAETLREAIQSPLSSGDHARLERYLAPARRTLGDLAARAAQAEGRALSPQQAIDLGLPTVPAAPITRPSKGAGDVLTARERAVATLIAQGLTNRQIAEQLFIAEGTAERHVGNILAKLEMNTRSQVAAWAANCGLLRADQHA